MNKDWMLSWFFSVFFYYNRFGGESNEIFKWIASSPLAPRKDGIFWLIAMTIIKQCHCEVEGRGNP